MKLITGVEDYIDELLELIYPSNIKCICCEGELENKIDFNICEYCNSKIKFEITSNNLYLDNEHLSDSIRVFAITEYNSTIKKLIYKFKYNSQTYLAREMANIMARFLEDESLLFDAIVPVPLFDAKKRKRGFNQSELLSKYVSEDIKIDYLNNAIVRTKNTAIMHNLTKRERRENVRGAFSVIDSLPLLNKHILLIDDIYTTGATIKECSKIILDAGAKKVTAMTFARSILT
ncbi:MAG: ComF family protein [Alkaliphilus sp.]